MLFVPVGFTGNLLLDFDFPRASANGRLGLRVGSWLRSQGCGSGVCPSQPPRSRPARLGSTERPLAILTGYSPQVIIGVLFG